MQTAKIVDWEEDGSRGAFFYRRRRPQAENGRRPAIVGRSGPRAGGFLPAPSPAPADRPSLRFLEGLRREPALG